ncbi:MAG: cell division protein [Methanomicrobiaceae archaeon]|nr:cell division protein [Methanomicrobiaceae archaeon]
MRVLAIGLGGAGCRIVDKLYDHDRRSGIGCMHAIAIDTDSNTLLQLGFLPDSTKFHFPALDPVQHHDTASTIDIEEIMTAIQRMDTVEIDAIMVFTGLGGSMADAIGVIVPEIRNSFIEPVFAVVTLPCLGEGAARSAKAADDIETIRHYFDAIILFDNETWYKKIREKYDTFEEEHKRRHRLRKTAVAPTNPRDIYMLLNERIGRQVGLLLRAGEFNEEGLEVAEVVLDAGEILNTLKGNGLVAIGYAAERLPSSWFDIFDRWRSARFFFEGAHRRAARIVSLAKRAVYEEISIPCDLTSAEKALVLIAGPSKELSMKGFQTVRKWIDRSIAGLEMRSGDYPVRNTGYVGIIIMLSGLENIPRINDIRKIRHMYLLEKEKERQEEEERERAALVEQEASFPDEKQDEAASGEPGLPDTGSGGGQLHDEKISLNTPHRDPGAVSRPLKDDMAVLNARKCDAGKDDGLILPERPSRTELDITRQTSGGDRSTPKNSIFEARDIGFSSRKTGPGPKDDSPLRVHTLPKANDRIINAERVTITPTTHRPKERIIDAERVHVASAGKKVRELITDDKKVRVASPGKKVHDIIIADDRVSKRRTSGGAIDNLLKNAEKSMQNSPVKPQEVDPGKRRINVIPAADQSKTRTSIPEEEEEDDLFWIT